MSKRKSNKKTNNNTIGLKQIFNELQAYVLFFRKLCFIINQVSKLLLPAKKPARDINCRSTIKPDGCWRWLLKKAIEELIDVKAWEPEMASCYSCD